MRLLLNAKMQVLTTVATFKKCAAAAQAVNEYLPDAVLYCVSVI
jgi:hypothetical protein